MINRAILLDDLKRQVKGLEVDLREQVDAVAEVGAQLRAEYDKAFGLGRTAATWAVWRDDRVTQAAVAWVLGTVFARFCEDNGLLPTPYLAGPSSERMTLAEEAHEQWIRDHLSQTDREWLLAAFAAIGEVQAGALLFNKLHNPLYQIPVSHDAAKGLITFWRRRGGDGHIIHDFSDDTWDTRFLGDLYQDLSERARKKYALLQTPEFVEEFILDRTLTPAINEFGYDQVKLIDPTCGSGHFLLGAFYRLLREWDEHAPGRELHERVRLALEAVHGVDINPFAVAIARFRLLVEALRAAEFKTLEEAAGWSFPLNIAVGDSLLKRRQLAIDGLRDELAEFHYSTEDVHEFPGMLEEGRYHVVVGNPPYVTVKDKQLNQLYRELYDTCSGTYALSVPFAQRFFEFARPAGVDGRGAGHVAQITANSFMKREFGKKLIEEFFAYRVELTNVINTSGAYIPGHGTPTVILVGRRKDRDRAESIRVVLGIRGEPKAPEDASQGHVWRAIVKQLEHPGSESEWISVLDLPRTRLNKHPWSIGGGGAADLIMALEGQNRRLKALIQRIGFFGDTHADEIFTLPPGITNRPESSELLTTISYRGDQIRDWAPLGRDLTAYPYDENRQLLSKGSLPAAFEKYFWNWRSFLWSRTVFGGLTYSKAGRKWWEWHQLPRDKHVHPWALAFAFVATHNHYVLDRGGKVFNRSAPIIRLPKEASESHHLRLLGVLKEVRGIG